MRYLILLRGTPGCGKSTWIKENNLTQYTLSADELRLLYRSPIININGKEDIDQNVNKEAWKTLYEILEYRMSKGELTVIDACNSKTSELNLYKSLAEKYRYRMLCVDFTDIPIEQAKQWNKQRPLYKQVSDEVIYLYYSRFATQKIPSGIKIIKRDELIDEIAYNPIDLSSYKQVLVIGDIHGCYTALSTLLKDGIKEDTYYIFCGDYLDRGIENKEVLEFLISIKDNENVCLLEGNHEKWLWKYANNETVPSRDFNISTKLDIQDIDKRSIRQFYRRLRQCAYFNYDNKSYFVTHGGISKMFNAKELPFVATDLFIQGIGKYEDVYTCQDNFIKDTEIIQIHGHRNPRGLPIKQNEGAYNLEGRVEFGEYLRAVSLTKDSIETIEIKNDVYNENYENAYNSKTEVSSQTEEQVVSVPELVTKLRENTKAIIEKKFDNISSFNFTRDVFFDKDWNNITTKARGLFINTDNSTISARAYDKFFNIGEVKETELSKLSSSLLFPINCYLKYNGFLGILGYNEKNDDLLFCSKSNIGGEYSQYFKNIFMNKFSDKYNGIKEYIKENNCSLIFEVIDIENDPHIIEYKEDNIVLLDVIKREIKLNKLSYNELKDFGTKFGFEVKELAYTLDSWGDFLSWYDEVNEDEFTYKNKYIEGFVIEDSKGFMTKLKGAYYKFWKFMRSVADETMRVNKSGERQGYIKRTSALTDTKSNMFYGFLRDLCKNKYEGKTDIITLRQLYINNKIKETSNEQIKI